MVDALRRARRWMRPDGCIIDIHPTALVPVLEASGRGVGRVDAPNAPERHAAADAALRRMIDDGVLVEAASQQFDFFTWADTFEELREYIETNWRDARLVLDQPHPTGRCRATERVRIAKLVLAGRRP